MVTPLGWEVWVSIPPSGTNLLGGCRQDLASLRLIHLMG